MKRFLLILLCFILMLGCVPATAQVDEPTALYTAPIQSQAELAPESAVSTQQPQTGAAVAATDSNSAMFYDDFSSNTTLISRGWEKEQAVQNERLQTYQDNCLTGVAGAYRWQNYRVEADMQIDQSVNHSTNGTAFSGILGRANQNGVGYEFAILMPATASATASEVYLRLYDRKNKKELGRAGFTSYVKGSTYHLAMEFLEDTVKCYIDDQLYIAAQIDAATTGTAGVNANSFMVSYDNFKVSGFLSYQPNLPANPAGSVYTDDFEDEPSGADPSHWVETIEDITEHIPTYGNTLIYDDFEDLTSAVSRGWEKEFVQQNGQMYTNNNNLWLGNSGAAKWRDYRVEADVTIDESTFVGDSQTSVSGLVGRSTKSGADGYELSLHVPTPKNTQNNTARIRLYDRKNKKELYGTEFAAYTKGATYHLAMEFIDNTVYCYVDDIKFSVAVSAESAGAAGVQAAVFFTYFDHFKVTEILDYRDAAPIEYFKTADQNGNRVYRGAADGYAVSWLHIFEAAPIVQADLCLSTLPTAGKAGVLGRYNVENSFVQAGYDFAQQQWFIASCMGADYTVQTTYSATAVLSPNTTYTLQLQMKDLVACLYVNGERMVECFVVQNAYGKVGVFVDGATADFDNVVCAFPSGQQVTPDVVSWTFYKDENKNVCEVDALGNEVIAFGGGASMYSKDFGKTFEKGSGPYNVDTRDYTSTMQVAEGWYLRILSNPMVAQVSTDMANWTTTATLMPLEEEKDAATGQWKTTIHVSSLTEITLSNGKTRIFLPVGFRKWKNNNIVGHYTRVFYSDDGGYTWAESENNTSQVPGHTEPQDVSTIQEGTSFCEAKVVSCADGTLRMYCTRFWATCVHYVESTDYGVTWSSWGTIPSMPCAVSSFAVCQDPTSPGTWYMLYIKDIPANSNQTLPRSHLVLCKSTDGKNWSEIMTVDRTTNIGNPNVSSSYYQFLDPCLTVTEGYFYFGYGRSDQKEEKSTHHAQRQRYLRIGREHTHIYDNACDSECDVCGVTRDVPDHVYDDDKDADCNECGALREILPTYKAGDLNGDDKVTDADAVYLLMHTFFPDTYPVDQPCDFNGDGKVTDADAVYLLMYTFFPDTYPIA